MAKRKNLLRSIMVLMLLFGVISAAGAQGLPGSGWFTSATIQNVGTQAATVSLEVYGTSGSPSTGNAQIPAGGNKVFLPGAGNTDVTVDVTPALGANFVGSMVVNSTQPVVAIGQVGNNPVGTLGTPNGRASAQFRGSEAAANKLSYPVVKNGFGRGSTKTTIFSIQAAGADVSYTATIKANNGVSYTKTGTIGANRSVTLLPSQFTNGATPMPSGCGNDVNAGSCIGSLVVEANNNIVGAEVETFDNTSPATSASATSLFATSDAGKTIFCPVFKNVQGGNRRSGGITVQNAGTVATVVHIKLARSDRAGTFEADSTSIAPGAAFTFIGAVGGLPEGGFASAELTANAANASIIAVASEANLQAPIAAQKTTTYSCFAGSKATNQVAFPVVKERFGATLSTTGVSIQNVGAAVATANVNYVCQGKSPILLSTGALAPGASKTFVEIGTRQQDETQPQIPNNSLCAVTATATGAADKIVGLANESSDFYLSFPNQGTLDTKNYEGFNLTP